MRKTMAVLAVTCVIAAAAAAAQAESQQWPWTEKAKGTSTQKQKVILDTDLASDLDDVFALALVLASPEFEVLGVTMDHGLTKKRGQVACRMLYEVGMEHIPVVIGRQTPMLITKDDPPDKELAHYDDQYYWAEGFSKVKPIETPAADFIIQMLRKYPHEVILFVIGPVPNIGDVVRKDPEALKLAKHIYAMYGSFYRGYDRKNMVQDPGPVLSDRSSVNSVPDPEFNVAMDVESSKLFSASGAKITYAPLDITTYIMMSERDEARLWMRHSPLTDALSGLYALWSARSFGSGERARWIIYDCVAIGMALWPELFRTRAAHVRVTDEGYTIIDESKPPNSNIGMTIRTDEFLKRLSNRWLYQNLGRP